MPQVVCAVQCLKAEASDEAAFEVMFALSCETDNGWCRRAGGVAGSLFVM
jgi:hypothetical protein